jgi:hypothetical protein
MGHLYELAGQPAASVEACEQGLRRLGESDERWIRSYCHLVAGCALFFMGGREAESVAAVSRALRVKHELGDIVGCGYALEILAWTAAGNGRAARAAWLLGGAGPLWEQAGGRLGSNAIMDQYHHDAVKRARGDLGDQRFRALFARGAEHDPGHLVRRALADAGDLRAPGTKRSAALTARGKEIAALAATERSPPSFSSPSAPWTHASRSSTTSSAFPPASSSPSRSRGRRRHPRARARDSKAVIRPLAVRAVSPGQRAAPWGTAAMGMSWWPGGRRPRRWTHSFRWPG